MGGVYGDPLGFMGGENMEDYNSDFLTMLETWEAAVDHLTSRDVNGAQGIEIASLLGWTWGSGDGPFIAVAQRRSTQS